jgi:hypothetical protein
MRKLGGRGVSLVGKGKESDEVNPRLQVVAPVCVD